MKRRNYIITLIFIVLCYFNITLVSANPIAPYTPTEHPILRSIFMIFIFIIGTSVEYLVYRFKFKINRYEKQSLMKSCYKVNLITFPITQIIAYIIYIYVEFYFWVYIIIVEFIVIGMEWGLFKIEFENHLKSYEFEGDHERFLSQKILTGSIIANSSSFLIGLLALVPPLFYY